MPLAGAKQAHDIYESVLETMNEAVVVLDTDRVITLFNRAAERMVGVPASEAVGRPYNSVIVPEKAGNDDPLAPVFDRDSDNGAFECLILGAGGRTLEVGVTFKILRNGDDFAATVLTISDLDRIRALYGRGTPAGKMLSRNKRILDMFAILPEVAQADTTVFIEGEPGTGRQLLALTLHEMSSRADGPFVPVNCSGIPGQACEYELFGSPEDAFPGRLGAATGGTLFLKDMGALPTGPRKKLLQALLDGCFYPIDSSRSVKLDARVISATSTTQAGNDNGGALREELSRTLAGLWFNLPPLRERREDLPLLIEHFLSQLSLADTKNVASFSPAAIQALLAYDFPGNVLELEHIIEHAFVVCRGGTIEKEHMPAFLFDEAGRTRNSGANGRKFKPLEESERDTLVTALRENNWSKQTTSRVLGITRTTLWRKMKKYSIKTPPRRKRGGKF